MRSAMKSKSFTSRSAGSSSIDFMKNAIYVGEITVGVRYGQTGDYDPVRRLFIPHDTALLPAWYPSEDLYFPGCGPQQCKTWDSEFPG